MSNAHNAAQSMTAPLASGQSPHSHGLLWAAVIAAVALLAAGCSPPPPPKAAPPVQVRTALVQQQTAPITRTGVGNVLPVMSVTVRTRVDGQLDSVAFTEGQDVKAGQVLARIDPRTYQAQLDQSLAQKAKDEATLANARVDLARYEELIQQDATTRQTLDTQRALVGQLQAAVQNDDAQIAFARVNLGYTTITAPFAGRAGARLVDPGNIVRAADAGGLLVINQIDPIAVQFTLPESAFQSVNAALRASHDVLAVQALERGTGAVLAEGKLALVNNQIDASTGTIALKGQFPNPQHKLWPGQSVDARLVLGQREQALIAPSAAVQRGQSGLYAYVIDEGGKAQMQPIQIDEGDSGARNNLVVVTQGLKAGERVVVDGHYKLTPGAQTVEMPAAGGKGGADAAPRSSPPAPASAQELASTPRHSREGGNPNNVTSEVKPLDSPSFPRRQELRGNDKEKTAP
ncbi:MAG: efflux RND transporter periplasmic adaptor subunit [Burkholderiaceae bacterium]|jgi:multidrug efflux system membrane fusion protein|nr:efflux RND transporter periplasmic adaptor subunit [Burkholderiaceae bacterium]